MYFAFLLPFHMVCIVRKRRRSSRAVEDSSTELRSLNLGVHVRDARDVQITTSEL